MLRLFIAWFALLALVLESVAAQSTTSSSAVATHTVSVGAGGLEFTPKELSANISDVIEFRFYPQNHSVARSEYKNPCIPYEVTGINKQGFWSGFHPINVVLNDPPKFQVVVNDSNPIFFYCSAPGACHEDGMIGVVNANSTQTFANQLEYARNSSIQFSPGENFPVEASSSSSSTIHATSTTSPTQSPRITTSGTAIIVTDPSPSSSSPSRLSPGAIAGIAIGASALVLLASALLYLCGRQRNIKEIIHHNSRPPNMTSFPNPHHPINPNPQSYIPPSASLSEATYYSKPRHLMTENEVRGLGQFSGAGSDQHSHISDSNLGSEGYGRSRSRSPGADEYGMVIPALNLGVSRAGTGRGAGNRSPSYQQVNTNANGSLPNSPGMPGTFVGAQVGTVEGWERERERERLENERQGVLRSSPSPGNQYHFHSGIPTSGPHELATHQDHESTRERTQDRYDDPEIDRRLADRDRGETFFWDEGTSR